VTAPANRSAEELAMRALIVPQLRARWPGARVIHELPLRYSSRRIDLAAVTEQEIVCVEIKSSRDVADRLEAQLRAFLPIASLVIVALAPDQNADLGHQEVPRKLRGRSYTAHVKQLTEAQATIERIGAQHIERWTVSAQDGTVDVTQKCYWPQRHPWHAQQLDMLHNVELERILGSGPAPHDALVARCMLALRAPEIQKAVCRALRARDAFCAGTDAPILAERVAA
jgi:hypothetical protein